MNKLKTFLRRLVCIHSPSRIVTAWRELHENEFGNSSMVNVGAFVCNSCGGVYDWYLVNNTPVIKSVFRQSTGKFQFCQTKKDLIEKAKNHV